ncbi:MAG: redox-sensing transcriptional repressor Rex [Acidimicrobiales bacterium]
MPERFGRRIPEPTVVRLPVYQRVLLELSARGVATVSSAELAESAGVNAAKVRKDLSHFGTYGTPGTGYDVDYLLVQIRRELGTDQERPVVIVGLGHLGHALARSQGFGSGGFRLVGLFDNAPGTVGEEIGGQLVRHISELGELCRREEVAVGIITTPAVAAQEVADQLAAGGIGAILNFAPAVISIPAHIQLRHVDFSAELQVLAFYQAHPEAVATREAPTAALRQALGRPSHAAVRPDAFGHGEPGMEPFERQSFGRPDQAGATTRPDRGPSNGQASRAVARPGGS